MALTSPGVEVTITDQSQYLPAPTNSVPFVLLATAQNKADPNGTGVAQATTAANANKLYEVTSQRDLVTLYGIPFFYQTTNGTPIQGYELNEYGLLAAYSLLGVTNRCYVLRADIDLASLIGSTGRPVGNPADGTYWLDSATSTWGIYEWNATTASFTLQTPYVITDAANISAGVPLPSIGNVGDYAVNALQITTYPSASTAKQFFYKASTNQWVPVGSLSWYGQWPTVQGTQANPSLTATETFTIELDNDFTNTITVPAAPNNTVSGVATAINNLGYTYLSAEVVDGKLRIFSKQLGGDTTYPKYISLAEGTGTPLADMGIDEGDYYQPDVFYGTAAQQPLWSSSQTYPRPSGSVWFKVGSAGSGMSPAIEEFNGTTNTWVAKTVSLATSDWTATASLDTTGGQTIPAGTVYGQYNYDAEYAQGPVYFWERTATGATVVTGSNQAPDFTAGPYVASIYVSVPGSTSLDGPYSFALADNSDATDFVTAWVGTAIPYTTATVTTTGAIQITHTQGGEIIIDDHVAGVSNGLLAEAGFIVGTTSGVKYGPSVNQAYTPTQSATTGSGTSLTINVTASYEKYDVNPTAFVAAGTGYAVGDTVTFAGTDLGGTSPANDLIIRIGSVGGSGEVTGATYYSGNPPAAYEVQLSNWVEFDYTPNESEPVEAPPNNTNWFYSVTDQVDIMVNYNGNWKGYKNQAYDSNGFPSPFGANTTDPNGPIVSASEPTAQSDGTALQYGDLWIDTSDLENYPVIYRYQSVNAEDKWVLIDNTDQTNPQGIVFADARWATNGTTSPTDDPIPTIASLLTSNYLDIDAPSASLYSVGTLIFNTRRSGYNIKQFKVNYFNGTDFPDDTLPAQTDAWVTVSGNQANGAPYMGRKAQRAVVVAALRSAIDTNLSIRDEDNFFNLLAAPNYPELQPNMIVLNGDRGETGYIIGDTPLRLADSATDIQAWATNAAGATSTGDDGLVTRSSYMGLFYPSGIAPDLDGNLVAVPPSHMMLRTFLRNDTIAYPWLAAAGTRRGIIDNATNIGYIDATTGEFQVIKTRLGIRDVLYQNFINPLVFFTGNGLLNYGNKSSFNSQSALDRTNVGRLVAFIRRQLTLLARPFVFEPNDALTRQNISAVVESLMLELIAKRGIYDYIVVCDESNNTPARIDRNELYIDIALEPTKAVEFIYIPVRILNTGELSAA